MSKQKNRYSHLVFDVLQKANITPTEYIICDTVYHLSRNPKQEWCTMRRKMFAERMNMSKRGIQKAINRMVERGFITKNEDGNLKYTEKWYDLAILEDDKGDEESSTGGVKKVHGGMNKVPSGGEQNSMPTESYNRGTSREDTQSAPARVNGVNIPDPLLEIDGFKEKYEFYCRYLQENYNRWPTSTTTEMDFQKLMRLLEQGNDPIKVIDQTIQGRNKSFYPLKEKKFDDSDEQESPFRTDAIHL